MASYPDYESLKNNPDKEKLLEVKRSIRSIFPLIFWFIVSASGVLYLMDFLDGEADMGWFSPRWLAVIPALFLIEIARRRYDDLYTFSDQRVQQFHGRLSLKLLVPTIKYIDIRSIEIHQSIWGRILNYGDISLGTAAQAEVELELLGVVSPIELSQIIERLRADAEKSLKAAKAINANVP